MKQVADEAGWTRMGDGRERPGNPFIYSFEHVCGFLLGAGPCTRQPACRYSRSVPSLGWRQNREDPRSTLTSGWGMSGKASWRRG